MLANLSLHSSSPHQIITALEEDTTAQKMQLGYRLQQIAAAVENKVTDLWQRKQPLAFRANETELDVCVCVCAWRGEQTNLQPAGWTENTHSSSRGGAEGDEGLWGFNFLKIFFKEHLSEQKVGLHIPAPSCPPLVFTKDAAVRSRHCQSDVETGPHVDTKRPLDRDRRRGVGAGV